MKRLVFLTLLWTALVATMLLRNDLLIFVEQKVFGPAAMIGTVVEALTALALGLFVSALIYTACAFFEGALLSRKESRNGANES